MDSYLRLVARLGAAAAIIVLVLGGIIASSSAVRAQLSELLTPEQQELLRQFQQSGSLPGLPPSPPPLMGTQQPLGPQPPGGLTPVQPIMPLQAQPERPPSRLEEIYSERLGSELIDQPSDRPVELRQFGYDIFQQTPLLSVPLTGAIQNDYVLGVGDEIVVTFRGQRTATEVYPVDREGRVVIHGLRPIPAAGRTFQEFRAALEQEVEASLLQTDVFVSLGTLRNVAVAVMGEVQRPGIQQLSSLSSVLDALVMAGGVKPTGSLRSIQIVRGEQIIPVDLYSLIAGSGATADLRLYDGDRILVPLIGETVAVAGYVKRPAIYELAPGEEALPADQLLHLAGGPWIRGDYRWMLYRIGADGSERLVDVPRGSDTAVRDGDILAVQPVAERRRGTVELIGHVRRPGHYSLSRAPSVAALIGNADHLLPQPYLPFAVLETTDPNTRSRTQRSVDLSGVLSGQNDIPLADDDRLIVLSLEDVRFLSSGDVLDVLGGKEIVWQSNLAAVRARMAEERDQQGATASIPLPPGLNVANGRGLGTIAGQGMGVGGTTGFSGMSHQAQQMPFPSVGGQQGLGQPWLGQQNGQHGPYALEGLTPEQSAALDERELQRQQREAERRQLQTLVNENQVLVDDTCAGLVSLAQMRSIGLDSESFSDQVFRAAQHLEGPVQPCPDIFQDAPALLPFALRNSILLTTGVLRPGLYPATPTTAVSDLVRIAGGSLSALEVDAPLVLASAMQNLDSESEPVMVPDQAMLSGQGQISDPGRIIRIARDHVYFVGHVRYPGSRSLSTARTIQALLPEVGVMRPEPYLLFGAVARLSQTTLSRELFPFSPLSVLQGRENFALEPNDVVIVFGSADVTEFSRTMQTAEERYREMLEQAGATPVEEDEATQQQALTEERLRLAQTGQGVGTWPPQFPLPLEQQPDLAGLPSVTRAPGFALEELRRFGVREDIISFPELANLPPEARELVNISELRDLVVEYSVNMRGEVRRPGFFPVVPGTPLSLAVSAAGGLTINADAGSVEYTQFRENTPAQRAVVNLANVDLATLTLQPKDVVRINPIYTEREIGSVRVAGEVRRPGDYEIVKGERLSSLLARAGGLNEEAYPAGAIFTRARVREQEQQALNRAANEIETQVAMVTAREDVSATELQAARMLAREIRTTPALGRVSVAADPAVLAARPDLDPLMEPGDAIFIPQRPITVAVSGEVLAPISITFDPDKDVSDYIDAAGGTGRFADEDRAFILLPNGEARPVDQSFWRFSATDIPPGSTIIVPRNPRPFNWLDLTTTTTEILARLATTVASIAVISR